MELLYKKRFQAMKDTPKERAKDYLKDFLSKKYFDIDQIGVWTPIEVIEFAESFAKQEVERACKEKYNYMSDLRNKVFELENELKQYD